MDELMQTPRSLRGEALQEYYVVQATIRDYDNRSFQIKSWSITLISAAAAGGLTQDAPSLFALAALASFGFWLVDCPVEVLPSCVAEARKRVGDAAFVW